MSDTKKTAAEDIAAERIVRVFLWFAPRVYRFYRWLIRLYE